MQTILLVGSPNSGKSTIFNLLSGGQRKVSNYSGITVDASTGALRSNKLEGEAPIQIVDLPGIYNLHPSTLDEGVTVDSLIGSNSRFSEYHQVAVVLDIQRLETSLALAIQLKELVGEKLLVLVNKVDEQEFFNEEHRVKLEKALGSKVLSLSALNEDQVELDKFIRKNIEGERLKVKGKILATKRSLEYFGKGSEEAVEVVDSEKVVLENIKHYQEKARQILGTVYNQSDRIRSQKTHKIDKVLIHPLWGTLIFCAIFYLLFYSIYALAAPAMDFVDGSFGLLADTVAAYLPEGHLKSLIVDGIIAGVGGVIIFLPQIMILFFLLSILEQSGYISRAAFLTDRVMGFFGLNGKAFLPYLSGFACSIPAIMSARTIPNKKERMATILTIPMITCSARLPVYILLVGTFVPSYTVAGIFNTQALSFFFLYFLGTFFALLTAKLFRLSFYRGQTSSFFIDLPHYQRPRLKTALKQMWRKAQTFLKKAGTIILGLSIIIWCLSTFPTLDAEKTVGLSDEVVASRSLENSALGRIGKSFEPVLKPIGMDWKMGVGVLVAFGARELFVSTLGTIYALGDVDEESKSLRERLKAEISPITGKPVFSLAVAWSLLIFFVFSLQCTATWAIIKKETGSWKYPIYAFLYMGALGYSGAYAAYQMLI